MITIGKKSRNKGSQYELKTAKTLTDWWREGKFSRVPASGGLHWGEDQRVAGDIIPPPEADFPFVIECKKREGWTMEHILLDIGDPRTWWSQVVTDGRRVKKTPLLFFSRNRAKDFVMVPYDDNIFRWITEQGDDWFTTEVTIENIREEIQRFYVIVTTFDTFSKVDKEKLKEYGKYTQWDDYKEDYE